MNDNGKLPARHLSRRRLLALAAGASVTLAGCGNDDNQEAPSNDDGSDGNSNGQDGDGETENATATETATAQDATETDTPQTTQAPNVTITDAEEAIHERVNDVRKANGSGFLDWEPELQGIARDHSEDMIARDYFDHVDPNGNTWDDRYRAADYRCAVQASGAVLDGGENIARIAYDEAPDPDTIANDVVSSWSNDSSTRSDLLATYWNVEGIGVAVLNHADGVTVYATQNFC